MSPSPPSSSSSPSEGTAPDLTLAALARRQHGVWNARQAAAVGFSRNMVYRRVRSGRWVLLDNAVYATAESLPTWHRQVMAAVLAEPWAVASHRASAVLHGIEGFRAGRPEVTIHPGANARGHLALAHRGIDVRTARVEGIPCSTLAQTFVDLAQVVPERTLRRGFDQRVAAQPALLDQVRERYVELAPRGGRNLRALKAVLLRFDEGAPTESELEVVLREVLDHPAFPPITWQAPFPGRRPGRQRVDAAVPAWKMVVEADGRAWHTRVDDFDNDRRRDAEAAAAGYQTMRFTWLQLTRAPAWVRATLLAAGAHRAA